ncbi:MAG: hypothetical protein AB7P37_19845 [Ramlibacter sp.]
MKQLNVILSGLVLLGSLGAMYFIQGALAGLVVAPFVIWPLAGNLLLCSRLEGNPSQASLLFVTLGYGAWLLFAFSSLLVQGDDDGWGMFGVMFVSNLAAPLAVVAWILALGLRVKPSKTARARTP